jgi:uncharacterized MAPEG superfamily protein
LLVTATEHPKPVLDPIIFFSVIVAVALVLVAVKLCRVTAGKHGGWWRDPRAPNHDPLIYQRRTLG